MVYSDSTTIILAVVLLAVVVVAVVVWLLLTRVFPTSKAGRHAAHFLDVGGADMSPEDQVKYKNQHPGAGGFG